MSWKLGFGEITLGRLVWEARALRMFLSLFICFRGACGEPWDTVIRSILREMLGNKTDALSGF